MSRTTETHHSHLVTFRSALFLVDILYVIVPSVGGAQLQRHGRRRPAPTASRGMPSSVLWYM